jgi:DmsE family decaheme c-type cytochrome
MYRWRNCHTFVDRGTMSPKRWSGQFATCASVLAWISVVWLGSIHLASHGFGQAAPFHAERPKLAGLHASENPHSQFGDAEFTALHEYARQTGSERPKLAGTNESKSPHPRFDDADLAALRAYTQQIGMDGPDAADAPRLRVAEADSAFEALREFLRRKEQPNSTPSSPPRRTPDPPRPATPRHDPPVINAHFLGAKTCLFCHASQAASFDKTLMGRISRTTHKGKLDCESCHGPGSAHLRAVGCAACHGEGGISTRPGMPSLVGQDPQYLLPAMRAYTTGQRKNDLMRLVLAGVSEAELNTIALYYARQPAARAQTPPVGDAAAGRPATALCANCHGAQGVSVYPGWPSLAGQDAQYLADAIKGYKHGSRNKAIACAGCHGEGGISTRPGMPSLAGLDPQYLVPAMKAYASDQRKHELMKVMVSGVSDAELNNIALFYAGQTPARAQTPLVGDPSAGRTGAALCTNCHGEQGGSIVPAWPSLAGQDSQYLAEAIRAYKHSSRNKIVACAGCHGEGGVSKRPGMPNLAGLSPQYLVAAMKAYVGGQRKHELMKALLTGVAEADLNDIAQYYAAQPSAPAPTPPVGNPSAGQAASAACAGCHGPQGISPNPAWPSLAGQDARYLAGALKGYKDGSRDDAIMKGLAAALDERTINDVASYYATLTPAPPSAQSTPGKRDPVLVANRLVATLDDGAINNIASYFASLAPAPAGGARSTPGRREPVVVRNGLVAALDERTANNVASYYASLRPAQPASARSAPSGPDPILVNTVRPPDGRSVGGIISFRKDDPGRRVEDNNAICLACHERGDRTYWNGSIHETRGVACSECHTVMRQVSLKASLKTKTELETCFQCHKDRRAQIFRSSHMPIREGKVTCSNCHNPHGSVTEALLKENSVNDNCYKCHAEKRGPFLFEHAPVRENCLSCHDPHGSTNEYLLKVSRPRLCAECHGFGHGAVFSGPRAPESFARSCQNCHTAIHGSNSPSGALLQR